jgi:hypothetical protein
MFGEGKERGGKTKFGQVRHNSVEGVDMVLATGDIPEAGKWNNTDLKDMIQWFKRESNEAMSKNKDGLLVCYCEICTRVVTEVTYLEEEEAIAAGNCNGNAAIHVDVDPVGGVVVAATAGPVGGALNKLALQLEHLLLVLVLVPIGPLIGCLPPELPIHPQLQLQLEHLLMLLLGTLLGRLQLVLLICPSQPKGNPNILLLQLLAYLMLHMPTPKNHAQSPVLSLPLRSLQLGPLMLLLLLSPPPPKQPHPLLPQLPSQLAMKMVLMTTGTWPQLALGLSAMLLLLVMMASMLTITDCK